mgnify:FL=1
MGEYDYTDINSIDYGKILKDTIGKPPSDMYKPHAHHVIFKIGNSKKQKAANRSKGSSSCLKK